MVGEAHLHCPPEQLLGLVQAIPQPPQFLLSVLVFTQPAVPQSVPEAQVHWLLAEQVLPPLQSVPPRHSAHEPDAPEHFGVDPPQASQAEPQ
jgi:hypothetical protein